MKQLALQLSDPPRRARTAALRSAHFRSHVTVPEAIERESKAAKQEASILGFFEAWRWTAAPVPGAVPGAVPGHYTPSEVAEMFPAWPVTSVRRAITNLTTRGKLVHHPTDRRPGPHGAKESTWSLA